MNAPVRSLFAPHPGKAALERWWLLYTPIWGGVTAAVMVSGWAESWGDLECAIFGLTIAAGALAPLARRHPSEAGASWVRRASTRLALSVVLLALGLNYVQTPFFFDVLHMHYGFDVEWVIDRNPVFLYLVTIAYFGTYCALCTASYRWLCPRLGWGAWLLAPVLVAFLETALNANPFVTRLFCYDDPLLVLSFGSAVYGFAFVMALPLWMAIDETPAREGRVSTPMVAVFMAALLFADGLALDVVRHLVAPHVTTVVEDAPGLGDREGSCLDR